MGQKTNESELSRRRGKNEGVYLSRHICYAIFMQLTSGAFSSAYLLYIGLNTEKISIFNFVGNAGLFAASIAVVFAYNIDRSGLGIVRLCSLLNALSPAGMLLASWLYLESGKATFLLLLVFQFISTTAFSMRNSAEINAVPLLFDRSRYPLMTGRCGYLGGLVTFGVSILMIVFVKNRNDIGYYRSFLTVALLFVLCYGFLAFFYRIPAEIQKIERPKVDFRLIFTRKYLLASIPHLTRGIGAAALALWPATIMSGLDMTPQTSSFLVPIAIGGEIIGSVFFLRVSKKLKPGTMVMIGYTICSLFLFGTTLVRSVPVFLGVYLVFNLLNNIFSRALMPSIVYACDKEELALMASFHVLYYAITYCPAIILLGKYMDQYTLPCMLIAGVIYIISGICMCIWFRKPAET